MLQRDLKYMFLYRIDYLCYVPNHGSHDRLQLELEVICNIGARIMSMVTPVLESLVCSIVVSARDNKPLRDELVAHCQDILTR
jgi:hypothetical protein